MKAEMLFTSNGPLVVLTSHRSVTDPAVTNRLKDKGIDKFIAYDLPMEKVKDRYAGHFTMVMEDMRESDELRILDINGDRIFGLFSLRELGEPTVYEAA